MQVAGVSPGCRRCTSVSRTRIKVARLLAAFRRQAQRLQLARQAPQDGCNIVCLHVAQQAHQLGEWAQVQLCRGASRDGGGVWRCESAPTGGCGSQQQLNVSVNDHTSKHSQRQLARTWHQGDGQQVSERPHGVSQKLGVAEDLCCPLIITPTDAPHGLRSEQPNLGIRHGRPTLQSKPARVSRVTRRGE